MKLHCPVRAHRLSECLDSEAETVMQLRSELREKEMKLTDIRLEALSSAHQLDQLREAMNRMQVCIFGLTYSILECFTSRGTESLIIACGFKAAVTKMLLISD